MSSSFSFKTQKMFADGTPTTIRSCSLTPVPNRAPKVFSEGGRSSAPLLPITPSPRPLKFDSGQLFGTISERFEASLKDLICDAISLQRFVDQRLGRSGMSVDTRRFEQHMIGIRKTMNSMSSNPSNPMIAGGPTYQQRLSALLEVLDIIRHQSKDLATLVPQSKQPCDVSSGSIFGSSLMMFSMSSLDDSVFPSTLHTREDAESDDMHNFTETSLQDVSVTCAKPESATSEGPSTRRTLKSPIKNKSFTIPKPIDPPKRLSLVSQNFLKEIGVRTPSHASQPPESTVVGSDVVVNDLIEDIAEATRNLRQQRDQLEKRLDAQKRILQQKEQQRALDRKEFETKLQHFESECEDLKKENSYQKELLEALTEGDDDAINRTFGESPLRKLMLATGAKSKQDAQVELTGILSSLAPPLDASTKRAYKRELFHMQQRLGRAEGLVDQWRSEQRVDEAKYDAAVNRAETAEKRVQLLERELAAERLEVSIAKKQIGDVVHVRGEEAKMCTVAVKHLEERVSDTRSDMSKLKAAHEHLRSNFSMLLKEWMHNEDRLESLSRQLLLSKKEMEVYKNIYRPGLAKSIQLLQERYLMSLHKMDEAEGELAALKQEVDHITVQRRLLQVDSRDFIEKLRRSTEWRLILARIPEEAGQLNVRMTHLASEKDSRTQEISAQLQEKMVEFQLKVKREIGERSQHRAHCYEQDQFAMEYDAPEMRRVNAEEFANTFVTELKRSGVREGDAQEIGADSTFSALHGGADVVSAFVDASCDRAITFKEYLKERAAARVVPISGSMDM